MDENTGPRRGRATAGATAMGATALLVMSFGPSALALSPSAPTGPTARTALTAPAPVTAALELPRRVAADGDEPAP